MIRAVKELAVILERLRIQPGDGIPKRLAKAVVHIQSEKYKGIAEGAWYGKAGGWESAAIGAAVIGSTRRHAAVTETVAHELGRHVASR